MYAHFKFLLLFYILALSFYSISGIDQYPRVTKQCKLDDGDQIITVTQVSGLQLTIPSQCLTEDVTITLTVYYWDSPYRCGLLSQDDTYLINLSPIIRLEPDGYLFNCQQSNKVMLQLPIPSARELCQNFNINNIGELALQLAQRNQLDDEWHTEIIADLPDISITTANDISCILIPISHFSDRFAFFKTIYSKVSTYLFPSHQQEVAAVGYLSSIDLAQKMANLTLY